MIGLKAALNNMHSRYNTGLKKSGETQFGSRPVFRLSAALNPHFQAIAVYGRQPDIETRALVKAEVLSK